MYNKTITRFGFCDIQNDRGRGRGYQPTLQAEEFKILKENSSYYRDHLNNSKLWKSASKKYRPLHSKNI